MIGSEPVVKNIGARHNKFSPGENTGRSVNNSGSPEGLKDCFGNLIGFARYRLSCFSCDSSAEAANRLKTHGQENCTNGLSNVCS